MPTNAVAAYIAALPADRRADCTALRKLIRAAAPKATESIAHGMPYYADGERMVAAFAPRAGKLTVYVDPPAAAAFKADLGKRLAGKSCIHLKALDDETIALLTKVVKRAAKPA